MQGARRTTHIEGGDYRPRGRERLGLGLTLALLIATIGLALSPHSSLARAIVPEAFVAAVPLLRVVTFPVLLPTRFDGFDVDRASSFVKVSATSHQYEVEMDLDPGCLAQNVCSAGSFSATDALYRRAHPELYNRHETAASLRQSKADDRAWIRNGRHILDRPTRLARGLIGYYTQFTSGADDGGNSALSWTEGTVKYELWTRLENEATLVLIADSAIRNGPLFGARKLRR